MSHLSYGDKYIITDSEVFFTGNQCHRTEYLKIEDEFAQPVGVPLTFTDIRYSQILHVPENGQMYMCSYGTFFGR